MDNRKLTNHTEVIEEAKKMLDNEIVKDLPKNIEILENNKSVRFISSNGVCYIIKDLKIKKTDIFTKNTKINNSIFINLFHKNKFYRFVGSYKDNIEKKYIYDIINNVTLL